MRNKELQDLKAYDLVEAPAVAEPSGSRPKPASAVPDMPRAAGVLMILAYAAIMGAFVVTIRGARADFAILIAAFYLLVFFGVPALFLTIERDRAGRPGFFEFLDRGIDTATGHISGSGALVQMLIVPVLLAFGVLAMGITYLLV